MSLNITTLIQNLWPFLHASNAADAVFWPDSELTRYFAESLKRLAQRIGIFVARDTTSITFVAGTAIYDAPARHLSTLHVASEGRPLTASSTKELEARDSLFQTRQVAATKHIRDWYSDKIVTNKIGFTPVPSAALAGLHPEVIFHQFPCNLDSAHTDVAIDAPVVCGDYLEFCVIAEAYGKEGDLQMPEVAQSAKAFADLFEATFKHYWGMSQ